MRLIVGLGNPGDEYKFTRHNAGFLVIDKILDKLKVSLNKNKFNGNYVKVDDLIIAKPNTYMNKSGEFISQLMSFFKILPQDLIVIHDEKDFPVGKSALKIGGSGGSHNGVKNIIEKLNSQDFKRLKVGIGTPQHGELKDYVLGKFNLNEMLILEPVFEKCADAAIQCAFNDVLTVMNAFNSKK
ncbi:aminoacyl-tRNA hydrolase [Mycoplasma corogypsi]|uniref:aminoacyl-tRNA hydrolase n=1 Tax=Mycoplasma corogypsi TaxID=2106 RepID=UPI003873397F